MRAIITRVRGVVYTDNDSYELHIIDDGSGCNLILRHPLNYLEQESIDIDKCYTVYKKFEFGFSDFLPIQDQEILELTNLIQRQIEYKKQSQ